MGRGAQVASGFESQQQVFLPARQVSLLPAQQRLLRALLVTGAGYSPKAGGHGRKRSEGGDQLSLVYCTRAQGWCEMGGRIHPVRAGELLVLPPSTPCAYGPDLTDPWTAHWVDATGEMVPAYLSKLGTSVQNPKIWIGDDLQVALLFNEVLTSLGKGFAFPNLLVASSALAHLLARCVARAGDTPDRSEGFQKIGRCIEFMSEHLDEPLKVGKLAALANLSPAHFAVVFKEQTGTGPREYLHLLRMHQACKWLTLTRIPLKEIAGKLGYQDQFHFSRSFKSFAGASPRQYRDHR